eukprot:TRINITY_DN3476_c0_g1_i2.p1 TRINITY_DN3476_c0_g1~~TRINITY_DN3476_c0_g1_i2.p1  ORF type:complete len:232 (+),score=74.17 TRINITY_DN3476_c0_g1_i2:211-906(+)
MFKGAKKDKDEKRKLKEFKEVTGASEDVAKEILKNFPNLDAALDHYFANTQLYNKKGTSTKQIDKSKLEDIFAKFATEEPDALFDESLRTYVTAIGVDPAHRNALYVFYKLGAKNAGELTKDEFVNGWISYGVDTLDGMTAEAAKSEAEMQNEPDFRDFYKWIFNYLKENKKSRTIRNLSSSSNRLFGADFSMLCVFVLFSQRSWSGTLVDLLGSCQVSSACVIQGFPQHL